MNVRSFTMPQIATIHIETRNAFVSIHDETRSMFALNQADDKRMWVITKTCTELQVVAAVAKVAPAGTNWDA